MPYSYLLPLLLIFLWYCLGRFILPVGEFYASVFVPVGKVFLAVVEWLQAFRKAHETVYSKQPGLVVIVRLIALVFALAAIGGEAYSSLIAIPALFGNEAGIVELPFPGLAVPAMAILFFALCSLFGLLWLESSEYIPAEARLFEVPPGKAKGFRRFAIWTLIASLIATALFYIERKFFLLDPEGDITTYLQIAVFLFLGILVPCAGAVALWIVAVGLQAVVNILFSIVAFVASIIVEILDFLSLHFTRGRMSVHDKTVGVLVHRRGVYVDEEKDEVLPHPIQIGENHMCKSSIGCYYGGPFGVQMHPLMNEKIQALGARGEIASSGAVSLYTQDQQMTSVGVNVSPTAAERTAILAASHTDEEANTHLLCRLGEKLIDVHLPLKSVPSSLLFFLDRDILTSSLEMLKMVKRQLPFHTIVVITMLDEKDVGKEAVRKGLQELVELYEQGVVTTIFVFSSRSPFAIAVKLNGGEVKQLEFVAQTLTSLLLVRRHSKLNASCVDVFRALGRLSPFISFAFAADRVARIKLRGIRALLMWLIGKKALVGDKVNIRDQAEHITGRVLADTECRAIDQAVPLEMPAILIYNLPLALSDKRFGFVQKELIKFLGRVYPSTKSLAVRGNGIPVHPATDPLDPFYVQVSCLYPLLPAFFEPTTPELPRQEEQTALPEPKESDSIETTVAASPEAAIQGETKKSGGSPKKMASA